MTATNNRINTLVSTMLAALTAEFTAVKTVEQHGGRFSLAELQRLSKKTPALLVSCLEIPALNEGANGDNEHALALMIFVLTRDTPLAGKDVGALGLTEHLCNYLRDQRWGLDYVYPLSDLYARNLYSNEIASRGIALWGIAFKQTIMLECQS